MNGEHAALQVGRPVRARHNAVTIAFHWTTVLLVTAQFALALLHDHVHDSEARRNVLAEHRSLGLLIWLLVLARLGWRLWGTPLLPFPASMARWHQWGARLSEWGLYALLLAQPLTGVAATVLRGRPFDLLGVSVPALLPPQKAWVATAQGLHSLGGAALMCLVVAHAVAAILHSVIANDGVLDSMLPDLRTRSGRPIPRFPQ